MIDNIRKITPDDLSSTQLSLESWAAKSGNYSEEKKWTTFLEALPKTVREAFLSMHEIDEAVRQSIFKETGKKNFGASEIEDKWVEIIKSGMNLNENDLYQVYSKLTYLYENILNQYSPMGDVGARMTVVARLKDFLISSFVVIT